MKAIFLHTNLVRWKAVKKAVKEPEILQNKEETQKDCLTILFAIENADDIDKIIPDFVKSVKDISAKIKIEKVVLYPWVHLTSTPSSPSIAQLFLKSAETALKKEFQVSHAPFGWYKEMELNVKGHPLSELSRRFGEAGETNKTNKTKTEKADKRTGPVKLGRSHVQAEELGEHDHRVIGQKLDLYSFQEVAPGMVFFHPKGQKLFNKLVEISRREQEKRDYLEIATPELINRDLWIASGHWSHYKENMFITNVDGVEFSLKPMNCPAHILVYKSRTRSYRDLPIRYAEYGKDHRNELSGVLSGLFRLRGFTQDDSHIFVTEAQLEKEVEGVVHLAKTIYDIFGFKFHVELSTRPKKFMGQKKSWDKAEKALENALNNLKMKFKLNKGDGAFYGPKIDFHIEDNMKRKWQCATCQVDFQMPERFDLSYVDKNGTEVKPVIIHRAIYGSLERFLGILVEHYRGNFPLWLAPDQIKVIAFTNRNEKSSKKLTADLKAEGYSVSADLRDSTVSYKIRDAETQKIPYILVIGDKEEKTKTIAVRKHGEKPKFGVKKAELLKQLKKESKIPE